MADYEFQESEVIFSMDNLDFETRLDFRRHRQNDKSNLSKKKKMGNVNNNNNSSSNNNIIKSVPVKIPDNMFDRFSGSEDDSNGDYYKEEQWDGGDMVPPHLIVRRRIAGKMAFSMCTGNGRPLKGRALSQVRNTILRMTGFLEA
ncbi:protein S40-3-like [Pyrus communis]|uniref:protein S40-3-like n=1 Tax=Pyrus communis TaxID=23211 RepID=UPI0035C132CA